MGKKKRIIDVGDSIVINNPDDLKKIIILRNGDLMDIDHWTSIPAPGCSKTEDAEFEIIEPKQLPPSNDPIK